LHNFITTLFNLLINTNKAQIFIQRRLLYHFSILRVFFWFQNQRNTLLVLVIGFAPSRYIKTKNLKNPCILKPLRALSSISACIDRLTESILDRSLFQFD